MEFFPKISLSVFTQPFSNRWKSRWNLNCIHTYLLKLLIYHFYEVLATPWHELISCAIRFWSRCHSFGNVGRVISIGFPESGVAFRRAQQMSGANALLPLKAETQTNKPTWKNKKKTYSKFCLYALFAFYIFI